MKRTNVLWLLTFVATLLLMAQYAPNHPSPATDDTVPVGSGTKWVSATLPNGTLAYDTATNTFSTAPSASGYLWTSICQGTIGPSLCDDGSTYQGGMTPPVNSTSSTIKCAALNGGDALTGNMTMEIHDDTAASTACSCTIPCNDMKFPPGAGCACAGALVTTDDYSVTGTGACQLLSNADPVNLRDIVCTVSLN